MKFEKVLCGGTCGVYSLVMANRPTDAAHWVKTATGYALGLNTLVKTGRNWSLTCDDGRQFDLGRRASFDHAESLISAA